jgi:5-methylcytosine-specific restriction enzyme A
MSLRTALTRIGSEWAGARTEPFKLHPLAEFIRGAAAEFVQTSVNTPGFRIKGSAGAGQWAAVPWIAVFDPIVTDSATRGYYVVYLVHATEPVVHLSLNQGTTATRAEFKEQTREVLTERAMLMRRRLKDFSGRLPVDAIEVGTDGQLPADYVAGHAMGVTYSAANLPNDLILEADLKTIVAAYKALTFRGGLDPSAEADEEETSTSSKSLIELRRYKMHRRIERNPKAAKEAKRHHGDRCQACDLQFQEKYGELGKGFIEAHHLRPIGSLEEGIAVSYDVTADFAVLCSNCHRMIHRSDDPSDLASFRRLVRS